jgi:hypothetical protein
MGKHITRLLDTLGAQSRNRSIFHYYLKTILYLRKGVWDRVMQKEIIQRCMCNIPWPRLIEWVGGREILEKRRDGFA